MCVRCGCRRRRMGPSGGVCEFWRRVSGPEERRLLELLSYGLVVLGAASALLLCFIPMPYGRYSSRRFGCLLPARLAWALQELPSLLVPLGLAACGGAVSTAWPNRLLLGCFVVHYTHRCGPSAEAGGSLPAGTGAGAVGRGGPSGAPARVCPDGGGRLMGREDGPVAVRGSS